MTPQALVMFILGVILGAMIGYGEADASDYQPYGGCIEAIDYPRSEGADICRQHGWTVSRHIIVRPDKKVVSWRDLPVCQHTASLPCHGINWRKWINVNGVVHQIKGVA